MEYEKLSANEIDFPQDTIIFNRTILLPQENPALKTQSFH